MIFTNLSIPDASVPILEDIAAKEGWTVEETIQQIWDRYAMPTVKAHENDLIKTIIQNTPTLEKLQLAIAAQVELAVVEALPALEG